MIFQAVHNPQMRTGRLLLALAAVVLAAPAGASRVPVIANGATRIEAVGEEGHWTGVRISRGDREVATIELISEARWAASKAVTQKGARSASVTLRGLDTSGTGKTPDLAGTSYVRFTLNGEDASPRVDFRFEMTAFAEGAWRAAWSGPWPVHFLCCNVGAADGCHYYYGGRLVEKPGAETGSAGSGDAQTEWVGGWSQMAAVGSLGIPAAGLWQSADGRFVAYSFQHARSTRNSCRDLAIAYRSGAEGNARACMAIVWPGGDRPGDAAYPSVPATAEGHFDLVYGADAAADSAPTELVLGHTWSHYRDLLPTVPRMNDLGWMVERHRLPEPARASAAQETNGTPAGETRETVDPAALWRHMEVVIDDPDPGDAFDPSFLALPLAAEPRIDQVDWAALGELIRSMIVTYVETGDPQLAYLIRGSLEKWPSGFGVDGYHMATAPDVPAPAAGEAGCSQPEQPLDVFCEWAQPVGDAVMHVTAGSKGAIAFCRGTTGLDVSAYRFRAPASFAFVVEGAAEGPFPIIFSSPNRDLSDAEVRLNGEPAYDAALIGPGGAHLRFTVEVATQVAIGETGDAPVRVLPPVPTHPGSARDVGGIPTGLECLDLASDRNMELDLSWDDQHSWAGVSAGRHIAYGVPYVVEDPAASDGRIAASKRLVSVRRRAAGVFLICSKLKAEDTVVLLTTGPLPAVSPEAGLPIQSGKPLRDWQLWLYPVVLPRNAEVEAIWVPGTTQLLGVTLERKGGNLARRVEQLVKSRRDAGMAVRVTERTREEALVGHTKRARRQLDAKIIRAALLPPHGALSLGLREALRELGIAATALRPGEVLDRRRLTPGVYPIAIAPWPDCCLTGTGEAGGIRASMASYLEQGGTLLAVGPGRQEQGDRSSTDFRRRIGLDLLEPGEQRDDSLGLSELPKAEVTLKRETGQEFVVGLPQRMALTVAGDCPFSPIVGDRLPSGADLLPVLTAYDADRKRLGVVMGVVRRRGPEPSGGGVIWLWRGLLGDGFAHSESVLFQGLATAAEICESGAPLEDREQREPYAPAVAVLPLADARRAELVRSLCADIGLGCARIAEDLFVEPLAFNAGRFPIAVHAAPDGRFLQSWRLPHDGTDAYLRYVTGGGLLVVCGGGPPFHCPEEHLSGAWPDAELTRPPLARALRLPLQAQSLPPTGELLLRAAAGEKLFPGGQKPVDVTSVADRSWYCLARVRGADVEWRPLAYLTDAEEQRFEGYAAAMIRIRGPMGQTGGVLYVCGELLEGERSRDFMRATLRSAMDEVQDWPSE